MKKRNKYKPLFEHYKLKAISVHSGKFFKYEPGETNIMLCTIEKANSFLNKLVSEGGLKELSDRISWIIIDEFHTIGDHYRGYYIESMISKILYAQNRENADPIQIVGMSATLPNLDEVWAWMGASLYMTDYRPVHVNEYVKVNDKIFTARHFVEQKYDKPLTDLEFDIGKIKFDKKDYYKILPLILQTTMNIANNQTDQTKVERREAGSTGSVLIFCPSKFQWEISWKSLCEICEENNFDLNSEHLAKVRGKSYIINILSL